MLATESVLGGRYRLGPIIGRGGGADVFRADDLESGRPVAIKVLRAVTPDDLHRFEQEGQTLARLDHPAIVRMCGGGESDDGVPYLVLDLIDGEPLSAVLMRGPLTEDEVATIGGVLASALAHAHGLGVVHRDVKPGNVLFDQDGGVHLTDFGIARLTDVTAITATGFVIGTAAYLAPEQVTGDGATPASDIYALGLVLLEAFTGERAYEGSPSEAALARLHRQPEIPPTAGPLGTLLGSMTSAEPALRPSASVVAQTLTASAMAAPADATAVLPIVGDATVAVPVAAAPVSAAAAAAAAFPISRPRLTVPPRWRTPLIVAAVLALVMLFGSAFDRNGIAPAGAVQTPTTTTAPPTTAAPAPVAETVPETTPPTRKGKKGDKGGGD
ncbi:MAG: eukaryotic-like serine/threonine-protein kinase [Acidimicrobiaceae bacterium]|nr:eukaryotic-like serine/threonine-protein kinase [Actinomycetota bacterium]